MFDIISSALDILYPRRCPICDTALKKSEKFLCASCAEEIEMFKGPVCRKCGMPLTGSETGLCRECLNDLHAVSYGIIPFLYEGIYKSSVLRFKYGGRAEYASFYAAAIYAFGKEMLKKHEPCCIIPVPAGKKSLLERGYNQAYLIAEKLSLFTGIPLEADLIVKVRETPEQKSLHSGDRRGNLRGAFMYNSRKPAPKRVLIVDDVRTTGSTIDAAACLLMENGTMETGFAAVCAQKLRDA